VIHPPPFGEGQRIGLFGGSFNPAHRGHYMVALYAMKRLELDWVWWLVSPQNPLKDPSETGAYATRLDVTRAVARHPRFIVTDIEQQIGSRTTADTLERLQPMLKRGRFVWIMGADSFTNLHHWNDWLEIPAALPLAVVGRPGYSIRALAGTAAVRFERARVSSCFSLNLPDLMPPAWVFLPMPLRPESSTALRRAVIKRGA
jgi:nicotinate-nucleotide adenylyltransferase